jgi:putative membrane protein
MDTSSFDYSSAITAHFMYFGIAIVATVIFVAIYVMITPHREFTLIREGNSSAVR